MPQPRWRIIFVDDEPLVLRSIRTSLRRYSDRFDCTFEEDSVKALKRLEDEHFDVIVSDMRMPNVDGPSLLRAAAALRPGTVRLVLSGFADRDSMLRALAHSHRFLSKPCHPSELADELTRGLTVLECTGAEHPPHDTVLAMTGQTAQMLHRDWNQKDALHAASNDPALMFRVLHATGTRFFGAHRDRFSVSEAIHILGPDTVSDVANSDNMCRPTGEVARSVDRLAARNQTIGRLAGELISDPESAELATCVGTMLSLSETMRPKDATFSDDAGKRLTAFTLGASGAPLDVCRAVLEQDDPFAEPPEDIDLGTSIRIAKRLVLQCRGEAPAESPDAFLPSLWEDWLSLASTML